MADVNERFKQMQASFRRIPQDLAQMVSPGFNQQLAEYLRNPPVPDKNNQWATKVHEMLPQASPSSQAEDPNQGLLRAYMAANTPRNTRPAVNPAQIIDQGLFGGRFGQIPQRAQQMYQGMLNAPGELAQLASPQAANAVQNAYQPTVSSMITNPPKPVDREKWLNAGLELSGMAPVMGMVGMTKSLGGPALSKADDAAGGLLGKVDNAPMGAPSVNDAGDILVDGQKVGRLKLDKSDGAVRIADIEISPSSQRKGYGSSVIQKVIDDADAQGLPVVLSTDAMRGKDAVKGQRKLYESLGFEKNKTLKTGGVKEEYVRLPRKK